MAHELTNRFNDLMSNGDDFFSNFGRSFFSNFDGSLKEMKSDIKETDKDYTLVIDVPGVDKKDMTIDYKDGILTVSAKRDSFSDESDSEGNIVGDVIVGGLDNEKTMASVQKQIEEILAK